MTKQSDLVSWKVLVRKSRHPVCPLKIIVPWHFIPFEVPSASSAHTWHLLFHKCHLQTELDADQEQLRTSLNCLAQMVTFLRSSPVLLSKHHLRPFFLCFQPCVLAGWLVGLCAGLCRNYWMDFSETWRQDGEWAEKEPTELWCGSG